jgi:hypothetical protein
MIGGKPAKSRRVQSGLIIARPVASKFRFFMPAMIYKA